MFSKLFGILLILVGVYFAMETITLTRQVESAMHQIYQALMGLTAVVAIGAGAILCAIGEANQHLRSMRNMETTEFTAWRDDRERERAERNTPPASRPVRAGQV